MPKNENMRSGATPTQSKIRTQQQQQQPYPVSPTNSRATYRVWGGWDVDRPCLYP
ncbi:hypothetical protein Hanom_Chr10g00872441 [Helianthus anomalus]